MVDGAGRPAAAADARRGREDRHPHARRAGAVWRRRAGEGHRGQDLRPRRRGGRARRLRPRRQAGAELEGLGAAAPVRAQAPAGEVVQAAARGAAIPAGALPDRAARRVGPLAALQRAGSGDAHQGREGGRRLGHQRPQAVHLQRLRRRPVRGLRQHQSQGRHAAGHVIVPGAARDQGLHGGALQRDARLPLHEQRRDGVRGHVRAGRSSAGAGFGARLGRHLLPSRQDHPGREESRRRRARLRGHRRLRAELRAGRAHPDQASGGGVADGRHGDQARGGARAAQSRRRRRWTTTRRRPRRCATWRRCLRRRRS